MARRPPGRRLPPATDLKPPPNPTSSACCGRAGRRGKIPPKCCDLAWDASRCVLLGAEVQGAGCGTSRCATGTEGSGPAPPRLAGFPGVKVGQAETPGAAELTDLEPATSKLNYSGPAEKLKSPAKPRGSARRGGPKRPRREEEAQHHRQHQLGHLGRMGNGTRVLWEGKAERKHLGGIHPGATLKAIEVSLYLVPALLGSGANPWPRARLEPSLR